MHVAPAAAAETAFSADGRLFPEGSTIIYMSQPYRPYAQTLLEVQEYPNLAFAPVCERRKPQNERFLPKRQRFVTSGIRRRVERAKRQSIRRLLVHRNEKSTRLNGLREICESTG